MPANSSTVATPLLFQLIDLEFRDARDETEVIVVPAAAVADFPPTTDVAMLFRIGVGIFQPTVGHGKPQALFDLPVIGSVVGESVSLRLEPRPGHDDVHVLRHSALHLGQQIGVQAELDNRSRLCLAREFGLDRLVRPTPEGAWGVDTAQDVDSPRPALVGKRPLNDHPCTLFHGHKRFGDRLVRNPDAINSDDVKASLCQMLNIRRFMSRTPFPQNWQGGIPDLRLG